MAMTCPECGADSSVLETTTWKTKNKTRRTYECWGSPKTKEFHRFKTHETVVGSGRPKRDLKKDD